MYPVPIRRPDGGANQGRPSWGPYLDGGKARKHEQFLIDGGDNAVEWDRRADARQAAWEASPFANSLRRLMYG